MLGCQIFVYASLLAFIAKYGVPTNQWTWLYQALLEVSMTIIALWICVCADDWAAESAIKASNGEGPVIVMYQLKSIYSRPFKYSRSHYIQTHFAVISSNVYRSR